jgi:hypothetical protein
VKLDARWSLPVVAGAVGAVLAERGIRAVLTGGACASLYTRGRYHSRDMDFIVTGPVTQAGLDDALASLEFVRKGDRYVHPRVAFYVEFPRGPLAIGNDYRIRPVRREARGRRWLALSATDACRDRLAAFYHWNDQQSLRVAVQIARENRVSLGAIRRWSVAEGFSQRADEFLMAVRRARRRSAGHAGARQRLG